MLLAQKEKIKNSNKCDDFATSEQTLKVSVAGTRTRVSRMKAEYPDQLDYNGYLLTILP